MPDETRPDAAQDTAAGDGDVVLRVEGLRKRYGEQEVVRGLSFTIRRGDCFGLLGPNGAGKTTTLRCCLGLIDPDGGEIEMVGQPVPKAAREARIRVGVVPQMDNLDPDFTVTENLVVYGRYFGLPLAEIRERAAELLAFARLDERRDSRVDPLSGGMKRRLTIARALINRPDLVLLDEPTTGLDPQARHLLWERLYRLKREGVTLVLTTHYMDEAEQLCDRLVIMDEGRIVAEGSPRQLIERYSTREVVELRFATAERQEDVLSRLNGDGYGERIEPLGDRVLIYARHGDETAARLSAAGIHPDSVLVRRSSLEDVFLLLTGRTLDE